MTDCEKNPNSSRPGSVILGELGSIMKDFATSADPSLYHHGAGQVPYWWLLISSGHPWS